MLQRLAKQNVVEDLVGELKQRQVLERKQRSQLVDHIEREFKARFEAERKLRKEISDRLFKEYKNNQAAAREDNYNFQRQFERISQQDNEQMDLEFEQALGTETWFRIINA